MKRILMVSSVFFAVGTFAPSAFSGTVPGALDSSAAPASVLVQVDTQPDAVGKGAEAFIDRLAQDGIGFLSDVSMTDDGRKGEFKKLLNRNFDLQTIARFSLGRYWKTITDAQRKEYVDLFKKMIVEVYSRRFSEYEGQKLEVRSSRPEGKADVLVNTAIVPPSGPEVAVDWRVRKSSGQYKVVDVVVEGVSMAMTQRADFASVIQRGGGDMNVLLAHLRR